MAFWQANWDVLKEEVMSLFANNFERGRYLKSLNATFWSPFRERGVLRS